MGRLLKGPGNLWRYIIDDFSGGMGFFGPEDTAATASTDNIPENMFTYVANARSRSGSLEPVSGDSTYSVGILSTTTGSSLFFTYQHSASVILAVFGPHVYTIPSSAATGTLTSVTEAFATSFDRHFMSQFLLYGYKTGNVNRDFPTNTPITVTRLNLDGPGAGRNSVPTFISGAQIGRAGTAAPTNVPTMAVSTTAGGLTTSTTYKYRLAWKYGTGGELGMGWKESATSITVNGATQSVSITVDQHPPNEYCHVVKRSLYRNTTAFQENFFLVTESAYTNTLPSSILDTASDASIELGEQTDPVKQVEGTNTASDPYRSEMLPPKAVYCCVHEGRLWLGDLIDSSGNRYPTSVAYSEISGISPRPDQFRPKNKISLHGGNGRMTGLVEWMGNLYCLFERAIFVLSSDPGPGRLPAFTEVVSGFGCTEPRSVATAPEGIYMLSGTLPILFDGSASPKPIGERISAILRYAKRNDPTNFYDTNGIYDQGNQSYWLNGPGATNCFEFFPRDNGGAGYWMASTATEVSGRGEATVMNGDVYFETRGGGIRWVMKKGGAGLGKNQGDNHLPRAFYTKFLHHNEPTLAKHLKAIRLVYTESVTTSDQVVCHVNGASAASLTVTFSGQAGKVLEAQVAPLLYHTLQLRASIGRTTSLTTASVLSAIELDFTMDQNRFETVRL